MCGHSRNNRQWRPNVLALRSVSIDNVKQPYRLLRKILFLIFLLVCSSLWAQTENSVLSDGKIYKIGVSETGVFRLDNAFLQSLGINPTTIDPRQIQLFGHGGGTLPRANAASRPEDLQELSIQVVGEGDGNFDTEDYVIFYGEGPEDFTFDSIDGNFDIKMNAFDEINYYFLKIGADDGARLVMQESPDAAEYISMRYNDVQHYEVDQYNLLHFANDANLQGSGQNWVGDFFKTERSKDFTQFFDFRGIDLSTPVAVEMQFAARSPITSQVDLNLGGEILSKSISRAIVSNIEEDYAKNGLIKDQVLLATSSPSVMVTYPANGNNNEGWLDYIELDLRRDLTYREEALFFTDLASQQYFTSEYRIGGAVNDLIIWDISDRMRPLEVNFEVSDRIASFKHLRNGLPRFACFRLSDCKVPDGIGLVENQNLHSIQSADYLIIYHEDFERAASKLMEHRRSFSNLSVASASISQVFNEFSSGKTDPTAIRDFAKMIYDRSEHFRFLVLIGDGSFDYRHIYDNLNNESFVPVFETEESFDPILSYPTDDYYALLSDSEGANLRGALDIAVGRLAVRTADEADLVVQKIIDYETKPATLGDWRTNILFVADDEDGSRHLDAADEIAEDIKHNYSYLNINKVYLDAFEQENTPGGVFNINAKNAINQNLFKGQLVVNYIGHGGSNGWAQERVLQHEDIDKWQNPEKLPLLITATCSFAGYDNPRKISAGEYSLTNPQGGSIALFTTVRAVYANSNERLTASVFDNLFKPVNGRIPTIGQILINSKNSNSADTLGSNARKFTLLGDPAMHLAIPQYDVRTLTINGKDLSTAAADTLKALSKVTVTGEIVDHTGQIASAFNGKIYPTIYDKALTLRTLAQDQGSFERSFNLQKSVIFKGLASVNAGRFSFTFVIPKDINYVFGQGKISYYAENGTPLDAKGQYNEIIVGGTNEAGLNDTQGPDIQLFMDDENFVYGGMTDRNPVLLIHLSDENGINVIGNSIGHDLTGVLDRNAQNTLIFNDFYEAAQDDHTSGIVTYPLNNLELGLHSIEVKAWDIANNSSTSFTEFLVVDESEAALQHVLNYPNPFTDNTCFQFEHAFPNQDLDIRVDIFTVSGRLVHTLQKTVKSSSRLSRDIKWDGRDHFGDPLANGIYIYRLKVRTTDGSGRQVNNESELQKLVILR